MFRPRMTELRWIALAVLATWGTSGLAAGLGPIRVQSELGQPLRASVTLLGEDAGELEANCVKARIESSDGIFIVTPQTSVTHGQSTTIHLSSRIGINEPAVAIQLGIGCTTPVNRTYQILLDPVVIAPPVIDMPQVKPQAFSVKPARIELKPVAPANAAANQAVPPSKKRRIPKADKKEQAVASDMITDVTPMLPNATKASPAVLPPPKKAVRNVLKLSGDDIPVTTENISPRLKMTDSLSITVTEADAQKLAEVRAAQAQFAAVMRDENMAQSAEERAKAAQAELETLKAQAEKLKQQRQADQAALVALQSESFSFNWVAGLIAVLAVCLAAIVWLLWRFYDIQKATSRSSWGKDVVELQSDPTDLGSFETGTAFGNTAFNTTAFGDTQFGDTVPVETDCDKITRSIEDLPTIIDLNPVSEFLLDEPEPPTVPAMGARPADKNPSVSERREEKKERSRRTAAPNPVAPQVRAEAQRSSDERALKAEEIADVMQLAELWVSLNDPKRAIQILEPLSELEQPDSPAPWIYLLDLYRMTGDQAKYEGVQRRIAHAFNAKIMPWGAGEELEAPRTLEDYPHIVDVICARWDGNDIVPYLESLLLDSRDGARDGFDLSVYRDIIQLISLASEPDPVARKEHMSFGQAHTILFRRSEQNDAAASKPAAAAPAPMPARAQPEKKPGFRRPVADAPAKTAASSKKAADESMGVPDMKLPGRTAVPSQPYLKEDAPTDPFAAEPAARKLPPVPEPVQDGDMGRKSSADTDKSAAAVDKKPVEEKAALFEDKPAAETPPATPDKKPAESKIALPDKRPAIGQPAAAPAGIVKQPQTEQPAMPKAQAASKPVPDTAAHAAPPSIAAALPTGNNEEDDSLKRSLEGHIDDDDSSVMATKLHLAIAYQDIGEKDGARLLLDEVIRGGTPGQSEKARMMLAILARGEE